MTNKIIDTCPICQDKFEKDSENMYWHLKIHLANKELETCENTQTTTPKQLRVIPKTWSQC